MRELFGDGGRKTSEARDDDEGQDGAPQDGPPDCPPVAWLLVHPEASPGLCAPEEHQGDENGVVGVEGHLATVEEDAAGTPVDEQPQRPGGLEYATQQKHHRQLLPVEASLRDRATTLLSSSGSSPSSMYILLA